MGRLRYLLDSNVLSEPSRRIPNASVQAKLHTHRHEVCTAALVIQEMRFGLVRLPDGKRKRELLSYLAQLLNQPLIVLPYDLDAALWHADERGRLSAIGRTPPFIDGQIAAITAINGLTLVTRNTRDFSDFTGLKLEDWFA